MIQNIAPPAKYTGGAEEKMKNCITDLLGKRKNLTSFSIFPVFEEVCYI